MKNKFKKLNSNSQYYMVSGENADPVNKFLKQMTKQSHKEITKDNFQGNCQR